mmetsp:Transcript_42697/g.106267  ORF Transcript_42697/g.106267 Transcript_42697/m.106267 type:complete len:94 (+) Transcript_42697:486-767(+)
MLTLNQAIMQQQPPPFPFGGTISVASFDRVAFFVCDESLECVKVHASLPVLKLSSMMSRSKLRALDNIDDLRTVVCGGTIVEDQMNGIVSGSM